MNEYTLRYAGIALAVLWAAWWVFFVIADTIGEKAGAVTVAWHSALAFAIFFGCVAAAWRWPTAGAVLLVGAGVFFAVAYLLLTQGRARIDSAIFVLATLALPPLVAGLLMLIRRPAMGQ